MDHLGLRLPEGAVPEYHGNTYDGTCSFQEFPNQQGWKLNTSTGRVTPSQESIITFPGDLTMRYSTFMQSWLFFGLIAAVVFDEDAPKFKPQLKLLVAEEEDNVITKCLPQILQDWRIREMNSDNARGRKMRMIRAQLTLDLARKVVNTNCSLENLGGNNEKRSPLHLAPELALSLMIIGETLTNAKANIIKQTGFHVRGWYGDTEEGWGTPEAVTRWMKQDHWCPRLIKLLRTQLRYNATALLGVYASHVGVVSFEGHGACNEVDDCKVTSQDPLNSKEYATKHHPQCTDGKGTSACQMRGVDMRNVIALITAGKIPLLRLQSSTESEQLQLELTDDTLSPEYATISHVWSDGYGNENDNMLYDCQLQYFHDLLKWAQRSRMPHKRGQAWKNAKPLPFWIDTLVIPVGKSEEQKVARTKAIAQIHNVFSKAKYTIVIDNGLGDMTWDDRDYTTTAMRILASGWMRRLWTLQEAFLSRKLLFAFKKSGQDALPLVDLDIIEDLYNDTETELISNLPATAQIYYNNLLGPDRKARIHRLTSTNGVGLIASVWKAAQWRTTSHKEHETLALATLLNLKSEKTSYKKNPFEHNDPRYKALLEDMMVTFWKVLEENSPGAIPPGIIFLPGDRIRKIGFGWAPTTWMSAHGVDHPDPISLISRPATLAPNDYGLSVEYPGFLLHCIKRDNVLRPADGGGFWFPSDNTLTEWYHAEFASTDYSPNRGIINETRSEDLAIILCRPRPRHRAEIGLLVEIHKTVKQRELGKDDVKRIFAVYIRHRITLKRELSDEKIQEKRNEILQSRLPNIQSKIICGEVLEEDQRWYVDCRITSVEEGNREEAQSTSEVPQTQPSRTRNSPFGNRGAAETGVQGESERGTSTAGTEADLSDDARTIDVPVTPIGMVASVHSRAASPTTTDLDKVQVIGTSDPRLEVDPPINAPNRTPTSVSNQHRKFSLKKLLFR